MKWFERLKERQDRYRAVFDSEDNGRWVLADLVKTCGFGQDAHVPGDPYTTHYNVGKQFLLLHIRRIPDMSDAELAVIVKQQEEMERQKDEGIFSND